MVTLIFDHLFSELAYKVNVQGTSVSSLKVELRKKDATITALEQLMASWQGGGRWGSRANAAGVQETGRRGDGHDGTDGARTPDQVCVCACVFWVKNRNQWDGAVP